MNSKNLVSNILFLLQILLLFLWVFESNVIIPLFLQPIGRMHPLILHFPIVLVILVFALHFFKNKIEATSYRNLHIVLLNIAALATALTALMGFFLSMEDGYASNLVNYHKWSGLGLSFLMYGLTISSPDGWIYKSLSYLSVITVLVTGHLGASLTHGKDFLFEPILAKKVSIDQNSTVFETVVHPIIESKCVGCHNPEKKKGQLDMSTWEGMQIGGENGQIWIPGNPDESDLIRRIRLEPLHDDHMPPDGKPQLSSFEIKVLSNWIGAGSSNTNRLTDYDESDSIFHLASIKYEELNRKETQKTYDFNSADKEQIASLNSPYRSVRQNTASSPALEVTIYVREAFKPELITDLSAVSTQIVNLNLAYMPIRDEDLNTVKSFPNLEKLNLNNTDIGDKGIGILSGHQRLETLSLAGTKITYASREVFSRLPALKTVYLWNSGIGESDLISLRELHPEIHFDEGYIPDKDLTLIISAPLLGNKSSIIGKDEKIVLNHNIPETIIYYTTDGSDPDSSSIKYEEPFLPEVVTTIKAIAYKKGWQPSEIAEFYFFIEGYLPIKSSYRNPPNQKYEGRGVSTLTNNLKGDINSFDSPEWLGYREKNFDVLFDFGSEAPSIENIVFSYGQNILSYIMKPVSIEVYGGNTDSNLKLLNRINLNPSTEYEPNQEVGINVPIAKSNYRFYRVVAKPLKVLPTWHIGAGDSGWVFVDEIFFY